MKSFTAVQRETSLRSFSSGTGAASCNRARRSGKGRNGHEGRPQDPVDIDRANYRCAGLADMAAAIDAGRPHRCSLDLATHVVEVMTAIL